jgi:hypothetical protein
MTLLQNKKGENLSIPGKQCCEQITATQQTVTEKVHILDGNRRPIPIQKSITTTTFGNQTEQCFDFTTFLLIRPISRALT